MLNEQTPVVPAVPPPVYPVHLDIDYPESLSRWKTFFRLILAIPVVLFLYLILYAILAGATIVMWVVVLVRGRIPRWVFDLQLALYRFIYRATAYFTLLTDRYPPFEGEYPIRYYVDYPARTSRWRLVIWKFISVLPQVFVLYILNITLGIVSFIAWFAILFTGRYPRGLHGYAAGVIRWGARVQAYAVSLTDEYPPFSLESNAGPAGQRAYVVCCVIGLVAFAGMIAGLAASFTLSGQEVTRQVSYERLRDADVPPSDATVVVDSATVTLVGVLDPADERYVFLDLPPGRRLVEFELQVENRSAPQSGGFDTDDDLNIARWKFALTDSSGDRRDASLVVSEGAVDPFWIDGGDLATVHVAFEIPVASDPTELRFDVVGGFGPFAEVVVYEFY